MIHKLLLATATLTACLETIPTEAETTSDITTVTCDSLHALKIAKDYRLASCSAPGDVIDDATRFASAGRGLLGAQTCTGLTANACAAHYREHPEEGLLPPSGSTQAKYKAIHVTSAPGLLMPDGTQPLLYYRAGTSNNWIIFLSGGANMCTDEIVHPDPTHARSEVSEAGPRCMDKLDYERQDEAVAGTGFGRESWKDLSDLGILGEAAVNPDFASYHRVWLVKPNDGFIGATTHRDVLVHTAPDGKRWRVDTMQTNGAAIVAETLRFLAYGGRTPSLTEAERVLFVASSSGVNAVHSIDWWHEQVLRYAPDAYVAMMLNSQIMGAEPWIFEARDGQPCESVYAGDCPTGHDDPPSGHVAYALEAGSTAQMTFGHQDWLDYHKTSYVDPTSSLAPGDEWQRYVSVGALLDASCVAAETAAPWKCRSRQYVMLNHVATPLFLAHSLHDGRDAVIKGQTSRLSTGAIPTWADLALANPGALPFETLTRALLEAYVDHRDTSAAGASRGAGPIGVWATACAQHEPEKSSRHFASGDVLLDDGTASVTLSAALRDWFENGHPTVLIDGRAGTATTYGPVGAPDGCD